MHASNLFLFAPSLNVDTSPIEWDMGPTGPTTKEVVVPAPQSKCKQV